MQYLWTESVQMPKFKALQQNLEVDVLVIGGGMAGILTALKLHCEGVNYALVEAKNIAGGITQGTTAVISAQHNTLYSQLIKTVGNINARTYLQENLAAVKTFRELSTTFDCDFEDKPSILYSKNDKSLMEQETQAVRSIGYCAEFLKDTPLPFKVAGAVKFPDMAQFHPLKFIAQAAKGMHIYENTFVQKIENTTAYTDKHSVKAKKIIVATHFPFINSHGLFFAKMYQQRSFVIALENAKDFDCTMEDTAQNGLFLRNYKNLLLVGAGAVRTGKKNDGLNTIRQFAKRYYPLANEKYLWANQDCMTLDDIPYIGAYSKNMPNVLVATGFNEWGMTSSMVAANLLFDMINGKQNPAATVFNAQRSMLKAKLFSNLTNTVLDFAYPTTKRCSHLGCALRWNKTEHSWDCPCHGSRFSSDGKVINNPAMRDKNVQ